MAKRPKKKTRKQKIAEGKLKSGRTSKVLRKNFKGTSKELVKELNEMRVEDLGK